MAGDEDRLDARDGLYHEADPAHLRRGTSRLRRWARGGGAQRRGASGRRSEPRSGGGRAGANPEHRRLAVPVSAERFDPAALPDSTRLRAAVCLVLRRRRGKGYEDAVSRVQPAFLCARLGLHVARDQEPGQLQPLIRDYVAGQRPGLLRDTRDGPAGHPGELAPEGPTLAAAVRAVVRGIGGGIRAAAGTAADGSALATVLAGCGGGLYACLPGQ